MRWDLECTTLIPPERSLLLSLVNTLIRQILFVILDWFESCARVTHSPRFYGIAGETGLHRTGRVDQHH